jgi:hypothetical protein
MDRLVSEFYWEFATSINLLLEFVCNMMHLLVDLHHKNDAESIRWIFFFRDNYLIKKPDNCKLCIYKCDCWLWLL